MKDRLKRILDRVKHYLIGAVPYRCFIRIFCDMSDLKFWHSSMLTIGEIVLVQCASDIVDFFGDLIEIVVQADI